MKRFISISMILLTQWLIGCSLAPLSPEANALIKQGEAGEMKAIHKLCYGYLRGKGLPKDYDEAVKWCSTGAKKGIPSSQTLLAEMYYFGLALDKDYKQAFHWYKSAALNEHAHAQYVLALMYIEGLGLRIKKPEKAVPWLKRSASKGHKKAQQKLKELEDIHSIGKKQ